VVEDTQILSVTLNYNSSTACFHIRNYLITFQQIRTPSLQTLQW